METIYAREGWFVSHLFYRVNRKELSSVDAAVRGKSRQDFASLVENYCKAEHCQLFCYQVWGSRADLGIMMIDPEFGRLVQMETEIVSTFPPGVIEITASFCSMSEVSEYMSQDTDYGRNLTEKEGLDPSSAEYEAKMSAFRERMQGYINERLYPVVPEHRLLCFYPMTKQRGDKENWYLLDFETRKTYMASHAITGRKFHKTVKQLVTGSIGLDDWEWGVSLFSDDPYYFKKILYEMRYDEASARFGVFGPFYVGIQLAPSELLERLGL